MSDFEILEHNEIARELYGIENKEITELELEALLRGKRLWTDINWEYAITIQLKDRHKELGIDKEIEKLKEKIEDLRKTNEEHRILNGKLRVENSRLNNIIEKLEQENAVLKTQVVNKDKYSYGIRMGSDKDN